MVTRYALVVSCLLCWPACSVVACPKSSGSTAPVGLETPCLSDVYDLLMASPKEKETYIQHAQNYINGIQTLSAEITQVVTFKKGHQQKASGQCWLNKSAQRDCWICVALPEWKSIIKDGILYNCNLRQKKISKNSVHASPLAPLFSNKLDIRKQFRSCCVTFYKKRSRQKSGDHGWDLTSVTLKTNERSSTAVTLFFTLYANGNIRSLIGWMVQDAAGTATNVLFDSASIKANAFIPDSTFTVPTFK